MPPSRDPLGIAEDLVNNFRLAVGNPRGIVLRAFQKDDAAGPNSRAVRIDIALPGSVTPRRRRRQLNEAGVWTL